MSCINPSLSPSTCGTACRCLLSCLVLCGALATAAHPAAGQERMYFSAVDDVRSVLVQRINAEKVRIDMSAWYLTEGEIVNALLRKHAEGVPIRLIGDRGSIFEIDVHTKYAFYRLAAAGVPIRLRYNPTWFPEIVHWKATIFVGQNIVTFGSANYTPFELAPVSSTNYKDETVLFTDDPELVNAFKTQFDRMWNDTAREPLSLVSGPPYFLDWNDACARESACSDYKTLYPNPAPMVIDRSRLEPDYPMPSDTVWGQGAPFNNRLVQEIYKETSFVDFVIYRLTVPSVADALLARHRDGVLVRLIIEPNEYLNRKWPEFWLTHAYIDKLWAAGVPVKKRIHQGLTHMKMLVTSSVATNASSNLAAGWQRDHNYFVPAQRKPAIYSAMRDRFNIMWNDTAGFGDFVPGPPDAPQLFSPGSGATGVSTTPALTWTRAPFATSFDVYLGTSSSSLVKVATVPAQLTNNPPERYSWTPETSLQGGTTYYWRVVSRTFAGLSASSPTQSFTTGGGGGTPPSTGPTPFTGTPVSLPGRVQAENFDNGAASVAYRDTTAGNSGGQYRATDVDIEATTDAGGGYNVGWMAPGEWLIYTVNVPTAGTYRLDLRVASSGTGGRLHVEFGGVDKTGPLNIPNTGGWQAWTTLSVPVTLGAGTQQMRLVVDAATSGVVGNVNYIDIASSGSAPPPQAQEIVLYAGDVGTIAGAWSRVPDGSAAGGLTMRSPDAGAAALSAPLASPSSYFEATFDAVAGVTYRLWLRMRAAGNSKWNDSVFVQFSGSVDGAGNPIYRIGTTSALLVNLWTCADCQSIGWGWQNRAYWLADTSQLRFTTTGRQTIRVQIREDGADIDQIVLSPRTYLSSPPGPVSNDTTIVPK